MIRDLFDVEQILSVVVLVNEIEFDALFCFVTRETVRVRWVALRK